MYYIYLYIIFILLYYHIFIYTYHHYICCVDINICNSFCHTTFGPFVLLSIIVFLESVSRLLVAARAAFARVELIDKIAPIIKI